jgi:hypothetical protein
MDDADDDNNDAHVVFTSTIPDFPAKRSFEPFESQSGFSSPASEIHLNHTYPVTVYRAPNLLKGTEDEPEGVSGVLCGQHRRLQLDDGLVVELLNSDDEDGLMSEDDV